MTTEHTLLDPTSEALAEGVARLARPASLDGLTVAVLDISKPRGDVFLDRIAERLHERGIAVRRYRKPTVIRPAPLDIQQAIAAEADVVVEGLAD
jgi:hypothetical protein